MKQCLQHHSRVVPLFTRHLRHRIMQNNSTSANNSSINSKTFCCPKNFHKWNAKHINNNQTKLIKKKIPKIINFSNQNYEFSANSNINRPITKNSYTRSQNQSEEQNSNKQIPQPVFFNDQQRTTTE